MKRWFLTFISLVILLGVSAADARIPVRISRSFDKSEQWLRDPVRTLNEVSSGSLQLAQKYISHDRLQEAIWTLRFGGHIRQADELENQLYIRLTTDPLLFISVLKDYSDDYPRKFKVGKGKVFGVFKNHFEFHQNEILAYQLDRLLELDIVPMTVYREDQEWGEGALQYFVQDVDENRYPVVYKYHMDGYPQHEAKMWLLDYLLDNRDRHDKNWFRRAGGVTVAIDHGHILGRNGLGLVDIQDELLPEGELLLRLIQLNPKHFEGLKELDLQPVFKRRNDILDRVEDVHPGNVCRTLIAS